MRWSERKNAPVKHCLYTFFFIYILVLHPLYIMSGRVSVYRCTLRNYIVHPHYLYTLRAHSVCNFHSLHGDTHSLQGKCPNPPAKYINKQVY